VLVQNKRLFLVDNKFYDMLKRFTAVQRSTKMPFLRVRQKSNYLKKCHQNQRYVRALAGSLEKKKNE